MDKAYEYMSEMRDHGWGIVTQWVKNNKLESVFIVENIEGVEDIDKDRKYSITGRTRILIEMCGEEREFEIALMVAGCNIGLFVRLFDAPGKQDKGFYKTISEINAKLITGKIVHHEEAEWSLNFEASQIFSRTLNLDLFALFVVISFNTLSENLQNIDLLKMAVMRRRLNYCDSRISCENVHKVQEESIHESEQTKSDDGTGSDCSF